MQKADLRRHLEQVYPNIALEQWFDPLDVRIDGNERAIRVSFPHIFFARQFRAVVQDGFDRHCRTLPEGWSVTWGEAEHLPARTHTPPANKKNGKRDFPLKRHTFSSFLHNRKNDFPLAAAKAAAAGIHNPPYVPLVIYGQSGAGKTHLLGAIANDAGAQAPDLNFFCGPALTLPTREPFTAVFLDDLQHVQDPAIQDRLALLLDSLAAGNGTFVCTLDAPPGASSVLSVGLAQRLQAGLVVELKKPDIEVRRRYAAGLCEKAALNAGKEQTLALAQRCTDFRAIDGAVNRARAYASLVSDSGAPPMDILNTGADRKPLTPEHIIAVTADFFSISSEQIRGKNRDKTAALARRYAVVLCRELLALSLPQIGRIFDNRDHSSIVYTIKKFKEIHVDNEDMHNTFPRLKHLCLTRDP